MRHFHCIFLLVFLLTACAAQIPADTGVEGQVTIGPMCPVVRQGQECPDKSYQATLAILTAGGRQVKQFTTDTAGNFRMPLAPGSYILHPQTPANQPMPTGRDQPFSVVQGQFTQIKVVYDSGIR